MVVLQTLENGTVDHHLGKHSMFDLPIQKMFQTSNAKNVSNIQCKILLIFRRKKCLKLCRLVWSHLVVLEFPSDHSECVVDEVVVDVDLQQGAAI